MPALPCLDHALPRAVAVVLLIHGLNAQAATQPLRWPRGTYGLPMPYSGCPRPHGFVWKTGLRFEDLENWKSQTSISRNSHFKTWLSDGDLFRYFCVKRDASSAVDESRPLWPHGNYCIYKKGKSCPMWFREAWVFWDDENGVNGVNKNFHTGILPSGTYNNDTKIFFCCQNNAVVSSPISLPTARPFYLIAFERPECQEVYGTLNRLEHIKFDTEDDNNQDKQSSLFPVGADDINNPTINYCYYQACRWTFTAFNGTLWTPNYPSHYKNSHRCQWHIHVPTNYSISLVFLEFKLEDTIGCTSESCACDRVDISEMLSNGTESVVGVYCMGVRFPTEPIVSNSNIMVVRFTPDRYIQSEGFKARYSAVLKKVPTTPTMETTQTTTGSQTNHPQTNTGTATNSTDSPPTSNTTITSEATSRPQTTPSRVTNISTEHKTSSASNKEPTDSTGATPSYVPEGTAVTHTVEPLGGRASQQRSSIDSTTVAVVCVLVFIAVVVTIVAIYIFYWKRRRKTRPAKKTNRVLAEFSSHQKTVSISTLVPDMYGEDKAQVDMDVSWDKNDDEQEIEETENPLYDSRAQFDTDVFCDKTQDNDEIAETDNPLYNSREILVCNLQEDIRTDLVDCETENPLYASTCQKEESVESAQLYESLDSIQGDDVTTVSDNPLYSRSAALGATDNPRPFVNPLYVHGEILPYEDLCDGSPI